MNDTSSAGETALDRLAALYGILPMYHDVLGGQHFTSAETKRLLLASRTMPLEPLLDQAADAFATALRGAEGREGVSAFLEKRKPAWADDRTA